MIAASTLYTSFLERDVLRPKWKLLSFNPVTDTWGEIIDGTYGQTPVDLTPYVMKIEHNFDRIQVTLSDDASLAFHPDAGALRAALGPGRVIRLKEGFEELSESEWLWTFSGEVGGTYSWSFQRGQNIVAQFTAYSRGNNQAWKRRNVTSRDFTIGSDWSSMFHNIAQDLMLLTPSEINVPIPWGVIFDKHHNQVVNYPPWDALEQLTMSIKARPWFNGNGQLSVYSTDQARTTLVLTDDRYLRKYESKGSTADTVNKVILTYLSDTLSRVDGPDQILGSATVTAGFFKREFDIPVFYSDERKTRCDNPRFIVKTSANAGLISFCSESMTQNDEFSSTVHVEVSVWAPVLATSLLAMYLALAFFPIDIGVAEGLLVNVVQVINPFGRIAQAVVLIGILFIMMCIGTGQYEIWGTPYEMVYLEEQAIAIKAGTEFWQERERTIRNDFISTADHAQALAVNELHYEVMKANPRVLLLRYDPRLEPGDIIQLSSSVKVWIEDVARVLTRNSVDVSMMTVNGYRTVM